MSTPIAANAAPFDLDEILAATGGQIEGEVHDAAMRVVGVSTDTRTLSAGNLFVALSGERFDGHDHLPVAREAGAVLALVERAGPAAAGLTLLRVGSTLEALRGLAALHLRRFRERGGRVLALTGSAGKTTIKEAVAAILRALTPGQALVTQGNLNNLVGAPMTALGIGGDHRYAVLELGTSERGEIPKLADMARPEVALISLISAAHTEGLGDLDAVAMEKLALFTRAAPEAVRIGNVDDARIRAALDAYAHRVGYGAHSNADLRLEQRSLTESLRQRVVLLRRDGVPLDVISSLLGEAGALAVAAAVAGVEALTGFELHGPMVSEALATFDAGRRLRLLHLGGLVIVDDSYNANPASCRSSLAVASEIAEAQGGRLVAVLGEMRELGERSESEHRGIGRLAGELAERVFGVGGEARLLTEAAVEAGAEATFAKDAEEAAGLASGELRQGDVLLVKGSRSVGTERVVDEVAASWGAR